MLTSLLGYSTAAAHVLCSRCTGYRPIVDAFRTFAKTDASAYSEEAISAARGGLPGLTALANLHSAAKGGSVCPSSGLPCDCRAASNGAPLVDGKQEATADLKVNGHTSNDASKETPAANGASKEAPSANGASKEAATANGTPKGNGCGPEGCGSSGCCMQKQSNGCCMKKEGNGVAAAGNGTAAGHGAVGNGTVAKAVKARPPSAEPIFPPELKKRAVLPLHLPGKATDWYRPTTLAQLLSLKKQFPAARLVVGNTEVLVCGWDELLLLRLVECVAGMSWFCYNCFGK
jgi:xanthine dehydrogenase/oxidase